MIPSDLQIIPNQFSNIGKSYFLNFKNSKIFTFRPRKRPPRSRKSLKRLALGRRSTSLIICELYGAKHSPSSSSQGGPSGIFWGVLLRLLFFTFNPKFSPSKPPPETKASMTQGFQTMRNPMVITIFFHLHGRYRNTTNFGVIFGSFWIENTKNAFRKYPNDSK